MAIYFVHVKENYDFKGKEDSLEKDMNAYLSEAFPESSVTYISRYTPVVFISVPGEHQTSELEDALKKEFDFVEKVERDMPVRIL